MITDVRIDLSRVPKFREALIAGVDRGIGQAAVVFEAAAKASMQMLGGGTAGQVWGTASRPGEPPSVQSGHLRNSITSERAAYAEYRVGTAQAKGKWMEYGANPIAKKGKYLTIPLNYEAKRLLARFGSVRNIEGLQIIARTKRGWLLGFRGRAARKAAGKTLRAAKNRAYLNLGASAKTATSDEKMFALVPSVRILPRPWLLPCMASVANQRAAGAQFAGAVNQAIRGQLAGSAAG